MGYLLTLLLAFPNVEGPNVEDNLQMSMWFSKESYCSFAEEKFTEQPMMRTLADGTQVAAESVNSSCRPLVEGEAHLIPEHMREKVLNPGFFSFMGSDN